MFDLCLMSKVVFCNKRVIFFGQFTIKICLFKAASKEYCMYIILRVLLYIVWLSLIWDTDWLNTVT